MAKQKKEEPPKAGSPAWMATFADLVTLLMCFFVILFSMAETDPARVQIVAAAFRGDSVSILEQGAGEGILESLGSGILEIPDPMTSRDEARDVIDNIHQEISQMASNFRTYFGESVFADNNDIEVIENEGSITIRFASGIMFDSGRAVLRPEALEVLNLVANELAQHPNNNIIITGHTDNIAINTARHPSNLHLGFDRAVSVLTYLVYERGIDRYRVEARSDGEDNPLVDNDTPENRARNRRVEIDIVSPLAGR